MGRSGCCGASHRGFGGLGQIAPFVLEIDADADRVEAMGILAQDDGPATLAVLLDAGAQGVDLTLGPLYTLVAPGLVLTDVGACGGVGGDEIAEDVVNAGCETLTLELGARMLALLLCDGGGAAGERDGLAAGGVILGVLFARAGEGGGAGGCRRWRGRRRGKGNWKGVGLCGVRRELGCRGNGGV